MRSFPRVFPREPVGSRVFQVDVLCSASEVSREQTGRREGGTHPLDWTAFLLREGAAPLKAPTSSLILACKAGREFTLKLRRKELCL
jgi:hypothetical protein